MFPHSLPFGFPVYLTVFSAEARNEAVEVNQAGEGMPRFSAWFRLEERGTTGMKSPGGRPGSAGLGIGLRRKEIELDWQLLAAAQEYTEVAGENVTLGGQDETSGESPAHSFLEFLRTLSTMVLIFILGFRPCTDPPLGGSVLA